MNVLEYLEEQVGYVQNADMPEALLNAKILSLTKGVLGCGSVDDEEDEAPSENYQVLEFTAQTGNWDEPVKFVMVAENADEGDWVYAVNLDSYVEENLYGRDDLVTIYEVTDEEDF